MNLIEVLSVIGLLVLGFLLERNKRKKYEILNERNKMNEKFNEIDVEIKNNNEKITSNRELQKKLKEEIKNEKEITVDDSINIFKE